MADNAAIAAAATGMPASAFARPEFAGHSLWLVPRDADASRYRVIIQRLAGQLGTPQFGPHITLLAPVEACPIQTLNEAVRELATRVPPLVVHLTCAAAGHEYFRCVYALCAKDEALVAAHAAAVEALRGYHSALPSDFMPHLSFVYGDLTPDQRSATAAALQGEVAGQTVRIDMLQLWDTQGPPADWRLVLSLPLSGGNG
jgi:2'-5' RNA ligase